MPRLQERIQYSFKTSAISSQHLFKSMGEGNVCLGPLGIIEGFLNQKLSRTGSIILMMCIETNKGHVVLEKLNIFIDYIHLLLSINKYISQDTLISYGYKKQIYMYPTLQSCLVSFAYDKPHIRYHTSHCMSSINMYNKRKGFTLYYSMTNLHRAYTTESLTQKSMII